MVLPASKLPISDSSVTAIGGLIAESNRFSQALEKPAFFLFDRRRGRPALDDFKREEAKEREARKLENQPKVFRDLGDRADAIELRGELSLRHREPKFLHTLVAIAGVGRNAVGFRFRCLDQFLKLEATQ